MATEPVVAGTSADLVSRTAFSVGVLGPLLVRADGDPVAVPAPKQRVILAALALRCGQALSYDELAEIIWDGEPPGGARAALRNYVKRLRASSRPGGRPPDRDADPGYALQVTPAEVDALRFAELCRRGGESARARRPGRGRRGHLGSARRGARPVARRPAVRRAAPRRSSRPRCRGSRRCGCRPMEWRMDAGLAQGRTPNWSVS